MVFLTIRLTIVINVLISLLINNWYQNALYCWDCFVCLNMLELITIICLDHYSLFLYLFVDVKKGERQMNLSMGRSFLFDMNAYIKGEHIMLIDIICICISLGRVFLIHLIGILSSSKKERLLSLCLILMIPKHLCCYF